MSEINELAHLKLLYNPRARISSSNTMILFCDFYFHDKTIRLHDDVISLVYYGIPRV